MGIAREPDFIVGPDVRAGRLARGQEGHQQHEGDENEEDNQGGQATQESEEKCSHDWSPAAFGACLITA